MDKNQKAVLKGFGGFLLIVLGLLSDDDFAASMAFSGGAALIISGAIDLLAQNSDSSEVPI